MPAQESRRSLKERVEAIARQLAHDYPDALCALHHHSAFELVVATILSAQCTDARVNMVTPALFRKYPDAESLAKAKVEDVEELIRTTGFFRNKAKNLVGLGKGLVEKFEGRVPKTLEEITTLPGVGRKTGNVVLGTAYGIPSGVVVDTHVTRLSTHLGLTRSRTAEHIERDLNTLLPSSEWIDFAHRLIWHGRKVCTARNPKCTACSLLSLCPRVGLPPLPAHAGGEAVKSVKKTVHKKAAKKALANAKKRA